MKITKNLISISGGNDSIAMLQWVIENREHFPDEEFTALYANTGWSISWWADRMLKVKDFCEQNNIRYVETESEGFENLVRKKGGFPNKVHKWCTQELKVKPITKWRKENKYSVYNSRVFIGVRREESRKRAETVSLGEREGYEAIYPLAYLDDEKRDELIIRSGFEVLETRSCECHPCIYEASKIKLKNIEKDKVELIHNLELDVTDYQRARRKLQQNPKYNPDEIFTMFPSNNLGGAGKGGIKEQIKWANSPRGKYQLGQEDMFCDDQLGYCGD